jgi:hypothetical protein
MGNRTTTTCDGAGCTAEHDNPLVSRLAPPRQHLGWAMVHGLDEKTGSHFSYDLCPACLQKMIAALSLVPVEVMHRAQMVALGIVDMPGIDTDPLAPPTLCATCKEPYVGESCYFCPPAAPAASTEDS